MDQNAEWFQLLGYARNVESDGEGMSINAIDQLSVGHIHYHLTRLGFGPYPMGHPKDAWINSNTADAELIVFVKLSA